MFDILKINDLARRYNFVIHESNSIFDIVVKSNFNQEADILITNFEKEDLEHYFLDTLIKCQKLKSHLVENYIEIKKDSIYTDFFESEIQDQLCLLKKELSAKRRNDTSVYKRVLDKFNSKDVNGLNELIIEKAYGEFQSQFRPIDKIIYISNFENNICNSIIYEDLFENVDRLEIFNPSKFEKLFISKKAFFSVVKKLETESIIQKENSKYYWQGAKNDHDLRTQKLLCVLFIYLYYKNYLVGFKSQKVVDAISDFFEGISVTLTLVERYYKAYSDEETRINCPYFKFFHFIL